MVFGQHAEYRRESGLSEILFYLFIFSIPFLAVSPFQRAFGTKVGYIYAAIVAVNFLVLLKDYGLRDFYRKTADVPLVRLLILFLAVNAVSVLVNLPAHGYNLDAGVELGYRFFSVGVYILVVILVGRQNLDRVVYIYLAASVLAALYGLYETIGYMLGYETGQIIQYVVPRLYGTAVEPQVFGNFLLSSFPLLTCMVLFGYNRRVFLFSGVLFILFLALVMTISAGAWAGMMGAALVILLFLRGFNLKGVAVLLLAGLLVSGVVWTVNRYLEPDYYMGLKTAFTVKILGRQPVYKEEKAKTSVQDNRRSFVDRVWFRQAAWNIFRDHPALGAGTGNYGRLYNDYRPQGTPFLDFKVRTHNQYLKILSENGIIGFGLFVITALAILFKALKNYFHADRRNRILIIGLTASLIGLAIHGYSFGFLRHNYSWVIAALLVAVSSQVEERWK